MRELNIQPGIVGWKSYTEETNLTKFQDEIGKHFNSYYSHYKCSYKGKSMMSKMLFRDVFYHRPTKEEITYILEKCIKFIRGECPKNYNLCWREKPYINTQKCGKYYSIECKARYVYDKALK